MLEHELHGVARSRKTGSELLLALAVWVSGSCRKVTGTQAGGSSIPEALPSSSLVAVTWGDSLENFPASLSKKVAVCRLRPAYL